MTDAELIAACKQVASLTEEADRHAYAIKSAEYGKPMRDYAQRWHDNRVIERAEVLALIRAECPLPNITPRETAPSKARHKRFGTLTSPFFTKHLPDAS